MDLDFGSPQFFNCSIELEILSLTGEQDLLLDLILMERFSNQGNANSDMYCI